MDIVPLGHLQVLVVNFFIIFEIFCFVVAVCDLVHVVEPFTFVNYSI